MFFWNSLAFLVIQWMLAIWSLVSLPRVKPAWTSGSSWFTYCWSLAWRILSITLLSVISASAQPLHSATISNCPLLFPSTVWTTFSLGGSYSSVISFCLFTLFILAFWRQEYWSGLPFPAPVDHILSDLSTVTCRSWVAPTPKFHWVREGSGPCDPIG